MSDETRDDESEPGIIDVDAPANRYSIASGIRINRLRLAGVSKPYEVDFRDLDGAPRGLSVIAGSINTGKSSVLEFISYNLGSKDYPDHEEIIRQVRGSSLEILTPLGRQTIERRIASNDALIFDADLDHLPDSVPEHRLIEPTGDPRSLSQFLLTSIALQDIQLKEAPTQAASGTDPLSMRDVMWLCYLPNERIGSTQLLFEGNVPKALKLAQVVDATFDTLDNGDAQLSRRIKDLEEEVKITRREVQALKEFTSDQEPYPPIELASQVEAAEGRLRLVDARIRELDISEAAVAGVSAEVRQRHAAAAQASIQARARLRDRESLVNRYASLRAQYADDIRKLTFLQETGLLFDQLAVTTCPACLSTIEPPGIDGGHCSLCNTNISNRIETLTLGNAATVMETLDGHSDAANDDSAVAATGTARTGVEIVAAELTSAKRRLRELNEYWSDLDEGLSGLRADLQEAITLETETGLALDRAASGTVTPFVAAREEILRERQEATVLRDRAKRGLRLWRGVEQRETRLEALQHDLKTLRSERKDSRVRPDRDQIIGQISSRFKIIIRDLQYPKHGDTAYVDNRLVPYVRNRPYRSASSGGIVLQTLAWALAVFEVAYEVGGHHPGFLLIDTPQKNLGGAALPTNNEFADVHFVERFYTHLLGWLSSAGQGAQVIVVDNTPPPLVEPHVVVRFTRDPSSPPFGLIDNEIS